MPGAVCPASSVSVMPTDDATTAFENVMRTGLSRRTLTSPGTGVRAEATSGELSLTV